MANLSCKTVKYIKNSTLDFSENFMEILLILVLQLTEIWAKLHG